MSSSHYKLTYFDGRGLAEVSRLLLTLGGADWEDVRLPIVFRPVEQGGPLRPEFDALKATGVLPFGQVPLLEVDGHALAQSRAIERFLARRFGLLGGDEFTSARIDAFGEGLQDARVDFAKANWWASPAEKEGLLAVFYETGVAKHLEKLEHNVVDGDVNLADAQLLVFVEATNLEKKRPDLLAFHPKLKARVAAIRAHPKVAAYLAARKDTPF